MSDKTELLPCPFCGAECSMMRNFSSVGRMDHYYLHCDGCGACGGTGRNEEQATKAWNLRAAPAAPAPAVRMCQTMQRPADECGCPDCGSSLVEWPAPAAQEPVAWLRDDGDGDLEFSVDGHGFPVYTAPPVAEQPYSTTSDKYRAELYDEVWSQARLIGYANVSDALAELQRMKLAEQPDTVKVPRELLRELADIADSMQCFDARDDAMGLLDKEGE